MFTFKGDSIANGGENNHVCAANIRLAAEEEGTFFCKPTASGRFVYIRNPGNSKVVVVCEVQVYSSYLSSEFSFKQLHCNNLLLVGAP